MEEQPDKRLENLEELVSLGSKMLEAAKKSPQILYSKPTEVANIFHPAPWEKLKRDAASSTVSSILKALSRLERRA